MNNEANARLGMCLRGRKRFHNIFIHEFHSIADFNTLQVSPEKPTKRTGGDSLTAWDSETAVFRASNDQFPDEIWGD